MATIITKLSDNLLVEIKEADEIWIAVALMSFNGLEFIINNIKLSCRQNYLIGIDLPTDPKALKVLHKLQFKPDVKVSIHTDKAYFHPKLYLIRKEATYVAFIGSANCTDGGLSNNVELTIRIVDQVACEELAKWFTQYFKSGKSLTTRFIKQYQIEYSKRRGRKKQDEQTAEKEKKTLNEEIKITDLENNKFIKVLKQYRNKNNYPEILNERQETIKNLQRALDYPNFQNINIDEYFSYWDLGHLIPIAIPGIKRELLRLKILLKYLCNENIDISLRYDKALKGDLKVEGVNKAFISKVLVTHRADLYFVKNGKSEKALKKYGIEFPRGLTDGEKYKVMCNFLGGVCKETNIENLAVLDYYLYLEGNES